MIEKIIIKSCAPFTDCISEINNTQIDDVKDISQSHARLIILIRFITFK